MHLNPSEYIIREFGGVRATARALGRTPASVSKWPKFKDKSGQVGGVPRALHSTVLKKAVTMGLDITPDDLIYGRKIKAKK